MSGNKKINILALTGIRSEYDLLYPLLKGIDSHLDFDLGVIVSGAHLSPLHDYSVRQIDKDEFRIVDHIENLLYADSFSSKAKSSAILMQSLAQTLLRVQPDLLLILGDREEAIIGSLTASYMNIPVVHIAGGDNTSPTGGDVDEQIRHATTKLSHVHLTMMEEHSERIKKLGEEPWRVFTVGSPGIDRLRMEPALGVEEIANLLGEGVKKDYIVLIYHPLSSTVAQTAEELRLCIEQCIQTGLHIFIGSPNSDPGYQDIVQVLQEYAHHPQVCLYKNLERNIFVNLLRNARCLVGNSSLAIHEAPYLCLPSVNVGERQKGRIAGKNVQFVPANEEDVRGALQKALYDVDYRNELENEQFIYGDGFMVDKTLQILLSLPSREKLLAKKITY
ncbi:putative UDP-N-acetylglucosamine 2-epimerase [Brevibacillus brevis NBRC 100599]|uniref:Putative UDP-N-acetylglucosamine 2-epimerase n=1 Tax=Brevibacillus brevis (strain 47 / JCM 6285 / NBRC 100599) TaxID=358681 RepID=C0Z6V6_BREBN|nr:MULTISPECIES: UDP-N-acetylglucosamine 2-epimerase [Bacillales]TQR32563.1 UDP-N-acetylglucosamine 2-epimerase (hydrolyzing) [Lysinibacillus sp. SDF0063]BAH46305.1 putative UDP-N-acetylglucosamine 2-epimerase [Brevibacillus brevis NBRC 100599]